MKQFYTLLFLICSCSQLKASDSLYVQINKSHFYKQDTIQISCTLNKSGTYLKNSTLNVIIENTNKNSRSQFRYPFINGEANANIIVGNNVIDGNYAIHFLVQNAFPQISGKIKNYSPRIKSINYLMLLKNKPAYLGSVTVEEDGNFKTPKFAFPDSANFVFFEAGKKNSEIDLSIENKLDSAFDPVESTHQFIAIGETHNVIDSNYQFDINEKINNNVNTLKTVVVKSKLKKKIEQFDEEYSSGLFKGGFPTIFDGIENESISRSFDIFTFLQSRVAGLTKKNNEMGGTTLYWRGQAVTVYIDEFKVDDDYVNMINVYDLSLIHI